MAIVSLGTPLAEAIHRDGRLSMSLRRRYLKPLERAPGQDLVGTLRAYYETGCIASSAADALGISRRTVANRIETAETLMGCSVITRSAEIQAALILDAIEAEMTEEVAD